jgi:hypothetical protein
MAASMAELMAASMVATKDDSMAAMSADYSADCWVGWMDVL